MAAKIVQIFDIYKFSTKKEAFPKECPHNQLIITKNYSFFFYLFRPRLFMVTLSNLR